MIHITDRDCAIMIDALRIAIEARRAEISTDTDRNIEIANDIARFERTLKHTLRETGRATEPDLARAKGPRRV